MYIHPISNPVSLEVCQEAKAKYVITVEGKGTSLNCIEDGTLQVTPFNEKPMWNL